MPSLGAGMETGILAQWLVKPGDQIKRGDLIAVVETQKGAIDVESFDTGTVTKFLVDPGTEVPVGTPLALIDGKEAKPTKPESTTATVASDHRPRISPAARRRARELGVDINKLAADIGGVVNLKDVDAAAHRPPSKPAPADAQTGVRQVIAAAMARSKREIPHYYLAAEIDLGAVMDRLRTMNATLPVPERLVYGVFLIRAVALAAKRFQEFNGYWATDHFEPAERVNVGAAISLRQGGLVAPALHNADQKDVHTLMRAFLDLVNRVRSGHMRRAEIAEPTITVSSLGEQGVDSVYPIIYPPQVAIVGFGSLMERPAVRGGKIVARHMITATLAADHRVSDGHRGALFLDAIRKLLEKPEAL